MKPESVHSSGAVASSAREETAMSVWKWPLVIGPQTIEMPQGAQILTVQMQNGEPQLWALCDPDAPKENRHIAIYGTGHQVKKNPGVYIETFQMLSGKLVFHAFEVTP